MNGYVFWWLAWISMKFRLFETSLRFLQRAEENNYSNHALLYASMAYCYIYLNIYPKAIECARKAQNFNTYSQGVLRIIKYIKSRVADIAWRNTDENACEAIRLASETWPKDSFILVYRAYFEYIVRKDFKLGAEYLEKAFQIHNAEEDLLYSIKGSIYIKALDKKEEGLEYLEKAVEINPCKSNRLTLGYELKEIDTSKAIHVLKELYSEESGNKDVAYCYSELLIREKKYDKALDIIKKALSRFHKDADLLVLEGYCCFLKEEYDKAVKLLKKGLKNNHPYPVYVLNTLAEVYLAKEELLQAKNCLERANEIEPNNPETQSLRVRLNTMSLS